MTERTWRRLRLASVSLVALTIASAAWSQTAPEPVDWAQVVGASVSGGALTKSAAGDGWNAGAVSTKALSMGDGYVELTAGVADGRRRIGLSRGDTDAGSADIDFALELDEAGRVQVWEAGEARGTVTVYAPADRLRIGVELGAVVYRKNGTVIFTSAVPPTYPLLVDTSLYTTGSSLKSVVLSGSLEAVAVSAPTFSVPGGTYADTQNVVLNVDTPGASLHYTTTGAVPAETDFALAPGGTLVVDHSLVLSARAFAPGLFPSRVVSASYTIGETATPTPTAAPTPTPTPTATAAAPLAMESFTASTADPSEPPHPFIATNWSSTSAEAILAAYTETQYLEYVPKQAPRHWDSGFGAAVVPGDTSWSWDAAAPNQVKSMPSGTVFPNAAYPIQYAAVPVLSGKTVMVPYHLAAGSTTKKSLPYAWIDYSKRAKLRSDLKQLASAYLKSGTGPADRDDRFARRVAVALDAWATAVPDYFMTGKNSPTFISAEGFTTVPSDIQRCSDHNGVAHEWADDDVLIFDAIHDSPIFDQLSAEKGYDVREHIKRDLYGNIGDYLAFRYPVSIAIATNLSGSFTTLAIAARVTNRPDWMPWLESYLDETVRRKILRDGVLQEGISYSIGYINENLDASKQTRDYFVNRPADTAQLQSVQTKATSYVTLLQFGQSQWNGVRLPDGQPPSFGDTTFGGSPKRNAGASGLLPAYGHAALGTGAGSDAVQLNQNWADDANHMRADVTAFTLFANNVELLGNVRYFNGTPGRNWGEQILEKNAVTIDRVNMSRTGWTVGANNHKFGSGNVTLFMPDRAGLGATEVDGSRAYANKASRYQRVLLLSSTDLARPYVIDVFRVTGGQTHDYTFHGAIPFDQTWESSTPLTPDPAPYPMLESGETWVEPTSSGSSFPYYGFWREVSKAPVAGAFQMTYRDTNGTTQRDVRLWVTDGGPADLYVGKTPIAERVNVEPPNFYKYWRPSLIHRRRISTGTQESLFANVVEPLRGGISTITSVDRLPLLTPGMDAVALRVTFTDGRVDTVLVNLRNPNVTGANSGTTMVTTADGSYALQGRVGVYSNGPAGERVWTIAATDFEYAGGGLSAAMPVFEGTITGFVRKATGGAGDAFVTSAPLPEGTELRGRQLSLRYETYRVVGSTSIQNGISEMFEIDRVERVGADTYVYLTRDHQLVLGADGKLREQIAPERTFEGPFTFQIATDLTAVPISPIADLYSPLREPVSAAFTVGDLGSVGAGALTVGATSSNPAVVPPSGLSIDGSGTSRTLTVTPASGADGKTTITVLAGDGPHTVSRSFVVRVGNVNDPPTITPIADRTIDEDTASDPIPFTVGDPDGPEDALVVTASSSDVSVIPTAGLVVAGSGAGRTLTVTPAPGVNGSADITVTVSDGVNSAATTFTATVAAVNHPPTISSIANRRVLVNGTSGPIELTIGDHETPAENLVVSGSSSNLAFVPAAGVTFGGSGAVRTVTVTPAANQAGSSIITVNVSDGVNVVSTSFTVNVELGPNLALNKPSSASTNWSSSFNSPKAFDGSTSSRWSASAAAQVNQWLAVDLQSPTAYNCVVMREISFVRVTAHVLQSSMDGVNYTSIPGTTGAGIGPSKIVCFGTVTARYFRLFMNSATKEPTINEVAVHYEQRPPVITVPADISTEATGPAGASVSFTASAVDDKDGAVPVTLTPASESTFPVGRTKVTATATDSGGNVATQTFYVEVKDTLPPSLSLPGDMVVEATGPDGAAATFTGSAHDVVSGDVTVVFSPASGATFPLGTTTVTGTATDAAGNSSSGSFTVTVQDTTAPALTWPADLTLEATSPAGAVATFAASAHDLVSGTVPVALVPPSGSTFPIGSSTVTVTASDAAGNTATGSFTVTVRDTTAPSINSLSATPDTLWPPDHRLVPIQLAAGVTDAGDPGPATRILSVRSNEPLNGTGDGDTDIDWVVTGDLTLLVRAERAGGGTGRVYTITVQSKDSFGNASTKTVAVKVPH